MSHPHWMYPMVLGFMIATLVWVGIGYHEANKPCQHYAVARTVRCTAFDISQRCIDFQPLRHQKMICVDDNWSWWQYEGDDQ